MHAPNVHVQHEIVRSRRDREVHALCLRSRAPLVGDVGEQLAGRNRLPLERHSPGLELGQIEQLLDQVAKALDLGERALQGLAARLLDAVDEILEPRPKGADRGSQLVGDVRHQVSPDPVDLLQLSRHGVERARQLTDLVARGRGDATAVVAAGHRLGGSHHLPERERHSVGEQLHQGERERGGDDASDEEGEPDAVTDPDGGDAHRNGGDDDDAELELDRAEKVERPHRRQFVSSA